VRKDLVDPEMVEQSMARFKNEARAAGRLLHPNIVSVYEYGEDDANAFIVMEYVEGTGLRDFLNRGAVFDLAQIATIAPSSCWRWTLPTRRHPPRHQARESDLDRGGHAGKVADFGIARIRYLELGHRWHGHGHASYMSPEQCQGRRVVDRRSDLFSAAVVFYELARRAKAFQRRSRPSPTRSVMRITSGVHGLRLSLSPMIDAVIATALEKNPNRFPECEGPPRALRQACEALSDVTDDPLGATQINIAGVKMEPSSAVPAWDDTVLRTIERQFAHYVGPMARVMIRRAAEQTTDVDELYSLLADKINDPVHRQRFFDEGGATASGVRGARQPGSTTGQRARAHTEALEQTFVDQTTMRLATYLGPIARVVAKRAAQKAATQDEFVQIIADHLGAQDRGAFLREIGFDG
jgi:serine/threonine-protein kinase